ncbi:uncharacterized protein N7515_007393 [Penicillium bovifimosum]|uniref:Uncharacterized protein n=1 Tax=Penicillium bovifimosum TaxID=126998 RepID=A0A9W9GWJ5_9EURO|nr:uncharacterized protein N7515_007393 [Penicillium bovifimosum]KAJ5131354.1 hypothetical protein N7515_007393 [Penicillium bovifimosum]
MSQLSTSTCPICEGVVVVALFNVRRPPGENGRRTLNNATTTIPSQIRNGRQSSLRPELIPGGGPPGVSPMSFDSSPNDLHALDTDDQFNITVELDTVVRQQGPDAEIVTSVPQTTAYDSATLYMLIGLYLHAMGAKPG